MKLYVTFIVFFICFGMPSAQTQNTSGQVGHRSAIPVNASVRFKPSQKGQFSIAQPLSFAALLATKPPAPLALATLSVIPLITLKPVSYLLKTTHIYKSLYPIKKVTLKVAYTQPLTFFD